MRADFVDADGEPAETAIEHEENIGTITARARVIYHKVSMLSRFMTTFKGERTWVEEVFGGADAIAYRLILELAIRVLELEDDGLEIGDCTDGGRKE